jgi:hypothetical protein
MEKEIEDRMRASGGVCKFKNKVRGRMGYQVQ